MTQHDVPITVDPGAEMALNWDRSEPALVPRFAAILVLPRSLHVLLTGLQQVEYVLHGSVHFSRGVLHIRLLKHKVAIILAI